MTRRSPLISSSSGFTLIEVMAVVALIGLLAGATAWSLADDAQRAKHDDVADRLMHADELARAAARRIGPRVLYFDLERQRVWVQAPANLSGRSEANHTVTIPARFRIDQVIWFDPTHADKSRKARRKKVVESAGQVAIPISSEGISRTYAIKLTGPKPAVERPSEDDDTTQYTWLLFSGMTGWVSSELNENELETILAMLASTRPDTD